jgi:hypothetical protein
LPRASSSGLSNFPKRPRPLARRLTWKSTLSGALRLATAIPLTINFGIRAFTPSVNEQSIPGLIVTQTHDVLSRITLCWPRPNDPQDAHVCVVTDDPPQLTHGWRGQAAVVARGMWPPTASVPDGR